MKCHYEVLDIPRDADDTEIKTAYRKLALKWHPDKNLDNEVFAKEQFQIVQQAYEVLSDRQERAWYDAHREQILRGSNSEFEDKSLDVFQYFTTTCFKGYTDDEGGFYSVYRKVFEDIAKEDIEFMEEKDDFCEIPGFGRSDSDYETVKAFYDYWMSYSTKKSYSWLDPYDIREGKGDRKIMKIIEKENKKVRLKAKKERNEEIRNLVAFVRKRDKRMQAFRKEMEAKTLENRKKQEELRKQKKLERKQMHAEEKQADWLKFDNVKSELEEIEKHLAQEFGEELSQSEQEEDEDFSNLYCVACNKIYKNVKAFANHEDSKKHRENVERLKESMLKEEEDYNLSDDLEEYTEMEENEENLDQMLEENGNLSGEDSIGENDSLPEMSESTKKKKKKNKKKIIVESGNSSDDNKGAPSSIGNEEEDIGENYSNSTKKSKRKQRRAKTVFGISDVDSELGTKDNSDLLAANGISDENKCDPDVTNIQDKEASLKMPSKKQVRKEKKANNKKNVDPSDLAEIDLSHCCVTCKNNFPSKNKLFDHLKKTGHGVYLPSKVKQSSKKSMKS